MSHEFAYALRERVKYATAEKRLFKIIQLRCGHYVVRSDSTLAKNLAAAVGELDFRRARWLGIVVIVVERNVFVVALDQSAAWRVVTSGGQKKRRVFAERILRLHEALAKARLADNQSAIVILD